MTGRLVPGKFGNVLYIDNYKYFRSREHAARRGTVFYLKCAGCGSNAITKWFDYDDPNSVIEVEKYEPNHNHAPDDEEMEEARFVAEVRNRIDADPAETVKSQYNQVAQEFDPVGNPAPSFQRKRSSLNRYRQKKVPSVPKTVAELRRLPGLWRLHN